MNTRERGKVWPMVSVLVGAFFVLVVVPLILHRQTSARMATVDPNVTIGDGPATHLPARENPSYRWPDSEVPRTAERLRDATAVAIAATTNVLDGVMHNQMPRDAPAILKNIAERQLIPVEWLTSEPGVLAMPHGTVHLRYLRQPLTIEVISAPNDRNDGPAILIRIPDLENTGVGSRYFESMQLDGTVYPNPFAPIAEIIASGWQPRLFKQAQIADEQRAQLEQWSRTMTNNK
jgi:hypothetical protein